MDSKTKLIFEQAIRTYGKESQMQMVHEEVAELQKEICKLWRGRDNVQAIAEEVADVEIMLDQLKLILDIEEDVQRFREKKITRLKERLGIEQVPKWRYFQEKAYVKDGKKWMKRAGRSGTIATVKFTPRYFQC